MSYHKVEGWLHDSEAAELQRLAKDKVVLEIGAWKGKSTVALASVAKIVHTIDHFKSDGFINFAPCSIEELVKNIGDHNLLHKVVIYDGDFRSIIPTLDAKKFGLVFYDADHTGDCTRLALQWILDNADLNNVDVCVHDYADDYPHYRDAKNEVDWFAKRSGRTVRLVNTLAVLERPQ